MELRDRLHRDPAAAWESGAPADVSARLVALRQLCPEVTGWRVRDLPGGHILAYGGVLPAGGVRCDGRPRVVIG